MWIEFVFMLVINLMFVLALMLVMMPLGIWRQAAFAVMKRNFVGYFSSPTGYVFLCLFVLLTSFAAFWPHEFFTTNLANFDQLNKFLPYIMLIFIPAITMSIWAEERRQGTDELLLTLPAKDFDIVIGKYFAAVLVFTVSLLFSQLSNYAVLLAMTGGALDTMLLFSTYLGYWFVGIAMIAIGMVASFLTNNLTVGFIFGAAFNAPLAFFSNADVIFSNSTWIQRLYDWSLLQRLEPFGRGLISLPSIFYFLGLVVLGVYLSLVLIGRRHWLGGRDGTSLLWHYLLRALFVAVICVSAVLITQYSPLNQIRADISAEKVSTLSEATRTLLNRLAIEEADSAGREPDPIRIDAYISDSVPTEFVQTKYDLVNLLREFDVLGGNRLQVTLHQGIKPFSQDAILAEKKYGISPVPVTSRSRGAERTEELILGVAVTSGLKREIIRFVPYGMPVEYELMRAINTVAEPQKKTIGVVQTDVLPMGGRIFAPGQNNQPQAVNVPQLQILAELQKQYNVEEVVANTPIPLWVEDENGKPLRRRFDALLVIQPSQMTATELKNVIDAIQLGQPTAIFEDALPNPDNFPIARGTFLPRIMPRNGNEPADVNQLFKALDVDFDFIERPVAPNQPVKFPWLIWKATANPYPRDSQLDTPELVIVRDDSESLELNTHFSVDHPATKGINELYFQYASYLNEVPNPELSFEPLVVTGSCGRILLFDYMRSQSPEQRESFRGSAGSNYMLAAAISGKQPVDAVPAAASDIKPDKQHTNVILVSDIDVLADLFVQLRNFPIQNGIDYHFQNMSFVQNIVDSLVGEDAYGDLRNRKQKHVTLRVVEKTTEEALQEVYLETQRIQKEAATAQEAETVKANAEIGPLQEEIKQLEARQTRGEPIDVAALNYKKQILNQTQLGLQQKIQNRMEELGNGVQENIRAIELDAELKIQQIQRGFKLAAVVLPPIPPLLVGLVVFTRRRLREREGISKARRLK